MKHPVASVLCGLCLWWACDGCVLRAAIHITAQLPSTLSNATMTLHRESLEERSSRPLGLARATNGAVQLRANSEPGLFTVRVGELQTSFVADDGQSLRVSIADDGGTVRVEGGPDQALYLAYEEFRAASLARLVHPVRAAIAAARTANNLEEVERLTDAEIAAYQIHRRELNDFTLQKLRGSPALYASSLRWDGDYRLDELAEAVREFVKQHPQAEIGRRMTERIERFRATAIGTVAPPLAGGSPDGKTISLQDLRGRMVLVDFWAAWCSPCRIGNRNYVRLYDRYSRKDFEILAVSVDDDASAWKRAIAQDGATWLHISDLTGWKSPLAGRYNVSALPASFLVDSEGRIIAKDVRGPELAALIQQHLKRAGPSGR